jgi:hypothetical protein
MAAARQAVVEECDSCDSEYTVVSQVASKSALFATKEVLMAAVVDDQTYLDSGCSRSMFGRMAWLASN